MNALHRSIASALLVVAAAMPAARASTPAAWAQLEKDAAAACAKASDLKDPVVHPATVRFDDTVGIDARWVTGAWKPAHMKGAMAAAPKTPVTAPVAPPKAR